MHRIRVKIKGYDHKVVQRAAKMIVTAVENSGAETAGPIPIPNSTWMMSVHRGPHIDAKSKEPWVLVEHCRVIYILNPNAKTIEDLTHLQLPAGVGIAIK